MGSYCLTTSERYLKSDLKKGLIKAIDNLYHIIKAREDGNERNREDAVNPTPHSSQNDIQKNLEAHGKLLPQQQEETRTLKETIIKTTKKMASLRKHRTAKKDHYRISRKSDQHKNRQSNLRKRT